MKRELIVFFIGLLLGFSLSLVDPTLSGYFNVQPTSIETTLVQPVFSPGSQDTVENLIRSARHSIQLEVYTFSSNMLKEELASAVARGVDVEVILDASIDSNVKMVRELLANGVKVKWGSPQFERTHAKFLVIDNETVFVGSNNWTFHSFNLNREAAVKLINVDLANRFIAVFRTDWDNGVTVN